MADNNNLNQRIILVDALRGFALLGIMLLHALEHFDFFWQADKNPEIFGSVDPFIFPVIHFLFSGKAYAIFSLMFGFSFFIQMDRNASKGINFTWKFLWRLTVLFIFGYLHSLWYSGDILTMYAFSGMFLIFFYRVNPKILVVLSVLLILQIPTIYNIIQAFKDPAFELSRNFGRGLWQESFNNLANGSLSDVVKFNAWKGHIACISWTYYNGRYLQMFGLFLLGLTLGKKRVFENIEKYKKSISIILIVSVVLFILFFILSLKLSSFDLTRIQRRQCQTLITSYANVSFMSFYVTLFMTLFIYFKNLRMFPVLANYGRMSLSSYIMQPLVGAPFFYGWGLAMYHYFGPTMSLFYGITFLIFQLWFCKFWMKKFYYGPLEWLWRAFTFINFNIKFKRKFE